MTTIRWFAAALFVTLGHSTAFAASGRITGTVFAVDGSRVSGATVTVEGSSRSARTDGDGDYRIDGVPAGVRLVLVVIHPGFEAADAAATVEPNASAVVDFRLKLARLQERIEIRGEIPLLGASEGVSRLTLAPSQIESLPSLGERDIFRAMQLLPGVSGSNETSSGLYVRGGTPDQNLVSYDGFTIYHVDHLFGYFTAFNMEAVDEVELHKGAYDARFGGRLSSVLELRGKAGSKDRYTGSITASMLSAGGAFSAPLGEKGSVLLAGRRSFQSGLYNDILGMFGSETGGGGPRMIGGGPAGGAPSGGGAGFVPQGGMLGQYQTTPKSYFYDLNAKAVYSLGPKDRVELSLFGGADNLDNSRSMEIPSFQPRFGSSTEAPAFTISGTIDTTDEGRWANRAGSLGWTRRWTPGSETRLSVGFSRFTNVRDRSSNSNVTITGDTGDASDMPFQPRGGSGMGSVEDNTLDDLTIRLQHRVSLGSSHRLELGAQVTTNDVAYQFDTELPGFSEDDDDISNAYRPSQLSELLDRDEKGRLIAGYVQDTVSLPGRVTLIPGLRVVNYDRTGETWLEPRVSLTAAVSDNWKLKGAFGQYRQVVNRITREDQAQGDREFWTLADGDVVPVARSSQAVAGVSYEAGSLLVDLEFFRKPMSDLTEYAPRLRPGQLPGESRAELLRRYRSRARFRRSRAASVRQEHGLGGLHLREGRARLPDPRARVVSRDPRSDPRGQARGQHEDRQLDCGGHVDLCDGQAVHRTHRHRGGGGRRTVEPSTS